jgi:tetratricopeptide (TPR) repeat protein
VRIDREAIAVLERLPPGPELADAYATVGRHHVLRQELDRALPFVKQALGLAYALDARKITTLARIDLGLIHALRQDVGGIEELEAAVQRATELGLDEHAAKGLFQLARVPHGFHRFAEAEQRLLTAETFCTDRGVEIVRDYALAWRADIRLSLGDWDRAEELAREVWRRSTPVSPSARTIMVGTVLGTMAARRGTPDPDGALAIAARRGAAVPETAMILGLPAARAEAAWLAGRLVTAVDELREARELCRADRVNGPWRLAEVCWWLHLADDTDVVAEGTGPVVAQTAGDWRTAAAEFQALGYPYHHAQALSLAAEEAPLRDALEICLGLGAVPLARRVARRLRALGVRDIPRVRPHPCVPDNPAGLTARELDVLALLAGAPRGGTGGCLAISRSGSQEPGRRGRRPVRVRRRRGRGRSAGQV